MLWRAGSVIAAPFIGSFLGVVIERLPLGETIIHGRSHCRSCDVVLAPRDMVPIASFLWLRGRCRQCGAPIPRLLPVIESAALVIAIIAAIMARSGPAAALDAALGWALLTLALIDAATFRLPDAITLPLLLAGLAVAAFQGLANAEAHAAAAALCYLGLRGLAMIFRAWRGIEGMGAGDAKLLAAGAAWLGPAPIPLVLVLAGLIGIGWFVVLAMRGRTLGGKTLARNTAIPFGPALAVAIWITRLIY